MLRRCYPPQAAFTSVTRMPMAGIAWRRRLSPALTLNRGDQRMFAISELTDDVIDDGAIMPSLVPPAEPGDLALPCLLIADDHAALRQALRDVLSFSFPVFDIVEASTAEEAVRLAQLHAPAVVIMDLRIPKMNGIAAVRLIKQTLPATRVVMF